MYRRNIAAAAAVLFLSSAVGISAYAAPQKDNSATEAETETETETERQTETETETETETQETEAATEREAGFVSIEEMPFEIETETETESSDQTETETETETEQKIESPKVEQTFRFFQVEKKYAVSKRDDVYLYEKKNTKSDKVGKINALGVLHILEEDDDGEWYYVESGKARGFIKAKYVWADEKAERYVKHKKEKNDAAKGKIFTIIGRELAVAVKEGGSDPNNNSRLRDVIAKAKANNMPNDTIERGIKKAAGADSADSYERATYEGYGPNGVAIIVETLTDNKNRTASNVRNAFTKGYGSIGTQGCVSFMFDQKGQIIIGKEELEDEKGEMDADELMMIALDAGAEDFSEEEDSYEVLTSPDDFSAVREALEKEGIPMLEAQIAMVPQTYVELTDEKDIKNIQRTLDLLDEDDDVTDVWTNWDE